MKILLVNDDGIEAQGLGMLLEALQAFGTVWVVAPHTQQSAIGHGITIHEPMRLHARNDLFSGLAENAWSLEGKPADCVKFAIFGLGLDIDVVVSGINEGPNLGTDVIYSGTLAAASEGLILGKKSLALSADFGSFDRVKKELPALLQRVFARDVLSTSYVVNVNFPPKSFDSSCGIEVCETGDRPFAHEFCLLDGVYWSRGTWARCENPPGTDVYAWEQGFTTISPITINRTAFASLASMKLKLE